MSKFDGGERVEAGRYKSLMGSLHYLTCTRPNISLSVVFSSQFMEEPIYSHWKVVKQILRYIRGTLSFEMFYSRTKGYKLDGYSDSDWCRDIDDQKSTSGYVFFMENTAITWIFKKQPIVTLLTREAEYVTVFLCVCHATWLRKLLKQMDLKQQNATEIRVDNKSAIELAKNPVNHERRKHIDVRFHFI
ncbi:secreted RxLR effector protein 161-like [Vicia villosa]|uniref:secreted RxLR effector protein 161-like n=1 Tax=Vicia villosa TaxID=3911 RepID=UPI00273C13B8|nr:secreted RxLR effector protein 161-like [Vicia villosa]